MDYSKLTLMNMMGTKMGYLAERTDVLSQNIANIDTPGYKARDLKELDFKRLAALQTNKLKMRTTSSLHTGGLPKMPNDYRDEKTRKTFETSPVENNISLEEQMAKIADTQMEHQMVTNLYRKTTGLFKTALGTQN